MALQFKIVPVTPFEQNCSVIWCDETLEAAVVDPGGDIERIKSVLEAEKLQPKQILLTHAHIDHAGATAELAKTAGLKVVGPHKEDDFWIQMLPQQCQMFGFPLVESFTPDVWLNEGDTVSVGNCVLNVLHCPGHTPGHVVFYQSESKMLWVGDVIFQGSVGRTDFPKGDFDTLVNSIKQKLWPLGDDVRFVPGHGPMSTIGQEKTSNPFVGAYG